MFDDSTGVTYGNAVGRNVTGHHRAGADGAVIANGDAGKDSDTTAYPHRVADGDGARPFHSFVSFFGIGGVARRVEAHIGPDKDVVAYLDGTGTHLLPKSLTNTTGSRTWFGSTTKSDQPILQARSKPSGRSSASVASSRP